MLFFLSYHTNGFDYLHNIEVENVGSLDFRFKPNSSVDRGVFAHKCLLQWKGGDNSSPAGQRHLLHWSLNIKDESLVPVKIKCVTYAVGEQTKVMLECQVFSLFKLEGVDILVHSEEAPLDKPVMEVGSLWYDPGNANKDSKVHWHITSIDESNRNGSIEFVVPGAMDMSSFFPIVVKFKARSAYTNLKLHQ